MVSHVATSTWSPSTHEGYERLADKDVYSSDGEKIGSIVSVLHPEGEGVATVGDHCLAVMPGVLKNLLGADVAYVPETAIQEVDADRVVLNIPADCLANQGWGSRPTGTECVPCS
ncbi:MAG: hypothetical protein QOF33_1857 [Thermomicrobiales bacterium]|jgi:hypothetical protein|nr:hypothetical protein [Thermomicrobiales bacterium]